MSSIQIERRGTYPIFKYSMKGERGWYATVFIDDEVGNITVAFDGRQFFGHWWKGPLREFLVSTNVGYINDKFSYGLDRWCGDKAKQDLEILLEKTFGHPDDWPEEIHDLFEDGIHEDMSQDMFQCTIWGCEVLTEKVLLQEESFGDIGANKYVIRFTEMFWESLIEHWKEELKNEINTGTEGTTTSDSKE